MRCCKCDRRGFTGAKLVTIGECLWLHGGFVYNKKTQFKARKYRARVRTVAMKLSFVEYRSRNNRSFEHAAKQINPPDAANSNERSS